MTSTPKKKPQLDQSTHNSISAEVNRPPQLDQSTHDTVSAEVDRSPQNDQYGHDTVSAEVHRPPQIDQSGHDTISAEVDRSPQLDQSTHDTVSAEVHRPPQIDQSGHDTVSVEVHRPPQLDQSIDQSRQHSVTAEVTDNYLNYVVDDGLCHVSVAETLASALLNSDLFCVDYTETSSSLRCGSLLDVSFVVSPQLGVIQANDCLLDTPRTTLEFSDITDSTVPARKKRKNVLQSKRSSTFSPGQILTRSTSKLSEVVRQSKQTKANKRNHLPAKQKRNSKRKKCTKTTSPVLSALEIPSDSEDSVLSDSDDEDECNLLNKKDKHCPESRRVLPQEVRNAQNKSKRYIWKDGSLAMNDVSTSFTGSVVLPEDILALKSPLQFFRYFFDDNIITYIAEQTNLYSASQRPEKPANVGAKEVEIFVGVCMYMSLIKMSSCKNYWSKHFRVEKVAGVMTSKEFLTMKRYLHFCDNNHPNDDRLRKIRALVDMLRCRFMRVPLEENLSIDEQMVPFKGRSSLKQYLPKKPHKWGYKIYVMSGNSGFAYDMEVYSGKNDNVLAEGETDCGASGNVVIRLSRAVPNNAGHKVFFDNYFCSPELQVSLAHRGIHSLGTVRCNRLPNLTVISDTELKKKGRGAHMEKVAKVDDVTLSVVRWFDNRPVTFLSTFVGAQPITETKRFSRVTHSEQQVACPRVVKVYNAHMGGVDLLDALIGLYRTHIRSKKWYHRIFFHLIDLTIVNSWLLYRRCGGNVDGGKQLSLHDFKACVAEGLCAAGKEASVPSQRGRKRGRPYSDGQEYTAAKRIRSAEHQPIDDVRYDGIGHWPKWSSDRQRCKMALCKGISRVTCLKCHVHLCCNPKKNCFHEYHIH